MVLMNYWERLLFCKADVSLFLLVFLPSQFLVRSMLVSVFCDLSCCWPHFFFFCLSIIHPVPKAECLHPLTAFLALPVSALCSCVIHMPEVGKGKLLLLPFTPSRALQKWQVFCQ